MAGSREQTRTIGAVLDLLKDDFPDLTISKIRFLESEGLITPRRTPSGYRTFSPKDVERLRYVLTAQRDRFWPLKVIRDALDAIDRGLEPEGPGGPRPSVPVVPADSDVPPATLLAEPDRRLRLTRAEVASATGLDPAVLDALATYGLLRPDADGHFPASALPIARAAAALASYGLEARHLRPFRTAADRELGLVQQVITPRRGGRDDAVREREAELLHHCIALHVALVKAGLQD